MSGVYKPKTVYVTTPFEKREARETVEDIKEYPYYSNPDRGVRDEIYKALGYRMKISEKDGKTLQAAYYPILKHRKLVGWKKRDFTKPKRDCFSIIGVGDPTCDLIGSHKLKPGRKITIVEGEEDLAAAYQAAYDFIQSREKWKGKLHPNIVSVVGGAPYAAENISHNLELLERYEEVVTAYDGDSCTPEEYEKGWRRGYEATCDTHLLLGFERCKYIPFDLKDPSEYLQDGKQQELAELLAFGAKEFTPLSLEEGDDYTLDSLLEPLKNGFYVECLPETMGIMHGLREYEGTLILAPSKSGKTSLTKQISYDIMMAYINGKAEGKIGHIFLEENGRKTRQSYLALDMGISLPKMRENPDIVDRELAQASYDKLYKSGKNIFLNTKAGKLTPDEVSRTFKYMYAKGCRVIILDHLSMVISGSKKDNERKEIDNLLTEIAAFCESHPVHVIVIAHIKRSDFKPKQDDDGEVIYPYWFPVNHTDARGCVDADTEFLTPIGWKRIADYSPGDKVAQYLDGACDFVEPSKYHKYPCDKMTHIKSNRLDMVLSDEHNIVYKTERTEDLRKISTRDALKVHESQATGFRGLIPTSFSPPEDIYTTLSEMELRVQVAVNADGWVKRASTGRAAVRVKKQRKKERIRFLLEEAGIKYSCYAGGPGYLEFSFIAPLRSKGYPMDWYRLGVNEIKTIVDEIKHWDGELSTGRFSSIDRREADLIQYFYHSLGIRASYGSRKNKGFEGYESKEIHVVRPARSQSQYVSFRKAPNSKVTIKDWKPNDGFKYCFTVPSGMLILRREGKIFITGNSGAFEQLMWNGITIEPEIIDEAGNIGRVRTKVCFSREWGKKGIGDYLRWDEGIGKLVKARRD